MRTLASLLSIALLVNVTHAAPAGYQAEVLADGPLLYYQLNEPSGTTVINYGSLGGTHDGTYMGAVTRGVAPVSLTGNPAFSIETVIRIPTGAPTMNYPPFMHWGTGLTGKEVFFSPRFNDPDRVYTGFYNGGLRAVSTMPTDAWHHVVWVRAAGGTTWEGTTLYIDGVAIPT